MHDTARVRSVERAGDIDGVVQRLCERERPAFDTRSKRLPFEILEYQVTDALVMADIVNREDVRMVQCGNGSPSRSNRALNAASDAISGGRTLTATVRSRRVSRALYTSPIPPPPSIPSIS